MRILVTGGNGQMGQSLAKVVAADTGVSVAHHAHELIFTDLPEGDITSAETMMRLTEGCDAIVNCAAWTNVDAAEDNEPAAMAANGTGPAVLASVAALRDIPLVHISTDYVFDGQSPEPLPEDAPTNPIGAYGRTKLAGEQAVRASGARAAIVRTAWLYSEFGNNFVKTMLRVGASRPELTIVNDQHGCPTYAPDLARAVLRLLENGILQGCEVYHFCGAGQTTWFDFASEIFALSDMPVEVLPVTTAEYGAKAPRPAWSVLSTAKIAAAGVAVPDWHDSLKKCLTELTKQ